MRKQGRKLLDPVLQTEQLDWLVVPIRECPDERAEREVVARHFRVPHEPWGSVHAFVGPVTIHRSHRRILFRQESGIMLR